MSSLLIADAAARAGLTDEGLRYHDADLQPERLGRRGIRVYSEHRLDAWLGARDAQRAARELR